MPLANATNSSTSRAAVKRRIDWVDYAKGLSLIMVIMLHSSLGVQKALGDCTWFAYIVEWARPFRIPAFFLLSGLFLARRIDWPWRDFLDRRVVHFAWFYLVWMHIAILAALPFMLPEVGVAGAWKEYLLSYVDPYSHLWFIYMLAIFAVVVKLVKNVPAWAVFSVAALLEILPVHTGWMVPDEFAARFVYFFAGYVAAPHVFRWAEEVRKASLPMLFALLLAWALMNAAMVFTNLPDSSWMALVTAPGVEGVAKLPAISLALGFIGALAVVAMGVVMARLGGPLFGFVRLVGERSLVVYVAFFLFMAATRIVLVQVAPGLGPDIISAIVLSVAVCGPLALHAIVRHTPLKYLFERPTFFRLTPSAGTQWRRGAAAA